MTPDIVCAIILLSMFVVTAWLVDIDWDQYRKTNQGTNVNNEEFINYSRSPIDFLEKLNLREHQKDAVVNVVRKESSVNAWARRSGKDIAIAASAIHSAIFEPYSKIVIYTPNHQNRKIMVEVIKDTFDWLSPDATIDTCSHHIKINNSVIYVKSTGNVIDAIEPEVIFFNECHNEPEIEHALDQNLTDENSFHIFATYSIILNPKYQAKYTKITWRDYMPIEQAIETKRNIGTGFFNKEFE